MHIATEAYQSSVVRCVPIDWPDLALKASTHMAGEKVGLGWMPARIEPGPRATERVVQWECMALDIEGNAEKVKFEDGSESVRLIGPPAPPLAELAAELELHGWAGVLSTSYSHEVTGIDGNTLGPRYRLVMPVSRPIKPDEIEPLCAALAAMLGVADTVDTGCFHANRLFYWPRVPPDRLDIAESRILDGEPLPVDDVLRHAQAMRQSQRKLSGERGGVIAAFSERADAGAIIERNGYEPKGRNRWIWEGSTTGVPGVVRLPESGRIYSHHSGDKLAGKHAHDAFSVYCELEHGGDVSAAVKAAADWLGLGRGAGVAAIPTAVSPDENPPAAKKKESAYEFIQARDLLVNPEPVVHLIDELIEHPSVVMLFGPSAAGKSFVAIDWSASIATETQWMGRDTLQGPVFYLAGEGHRGIARRLRAWEKHHDRSLDDAPLYVSRVAADLLDPSNLEDVISAVKALKAEHGAPAVVVIDTLARNMGAGDESKTADMNQFIRAVDAIRDEVGNVTVIIVHHSGHMEADRARGSSSLPAAIDFNFKLEKTSNNSMTLHHLKVKDGAVPPSIRMQLVEVDTGWLDTKGRSVTSAVVMPGSDLAGGPASDRKLTTSGRAAMDAFYTAAAIHGVDTPDGSRVEMHLEKWREQFYAKSTADNAEAKKKAFQRARQELIDRGLLQVHDDMYSCPVGAPEMIGARFVAGHGTAPGHVGTNVPPSDSAEPGQTGHTPLGVSRCPAADVDAELQEDKQENQSADVPAAPQPSPRRKKPASGSAKTKAPRKTSAANNTNDDAGMEANP